MMELFSKTILAKYSKRNVWMGSKYPCGLITKKPLNCKELPATFNKEQMGEKTWSEYFKLFVLLP